MKGLLHPALPCTGWENWEAGMETSNWWEAWQLKLGRPVRVLHIGNVANNAYNNAKLINSIGLDCDVLCYDYYHIMGCPEWEDADFDGDLGDQFRPDWTKVELNGYTRPLWFVQGPLRLCIDYLIAKRSGGTEKAQRLWCELGECNRTRRASVWKRTWILLLPSRNGLTRLLRFALRPERVAGKLAQFRAGLKVRKSWWRSAAGGVIERGTPVLLAICRALVELAVSLPGNGRRSGNFDFDTAVRRLTGAFSSAFPDRMDSLSKTDLAPYRYPIARWYALFKHYDIVQAYGIDPAWTLVAGPPYLAFEHGTLREVPFSSDALGRVIALAYHEAFHVFVTNADCLSNAYRLAGDRCTFINHPYDEDHCLAIEGWRHLRRQLRDELEAEVVFFYPTRHDWVPGTGDADKSNDVFLRAFARLRGEGHRIGLVCCRWGRNVHESRALLAQLGCAASVLWVQPMGMVRFDRTALACDVVVDQFKLGSFGGITFKALAAGAPVCTYLDEAQVRRVLPEPPPVINCRDEEEIVERLDALLSEPIRLKDLGRRSRAWVKRYHSSREVVEAQLRVYAKLLETKLSEKQL